MTILFTLYAGYGVLSLIGTHVGRKLLHPIQPTKLNTILGINQSILWGSLYAYTLIFNLVVLPPRLDSHLGVGGLADVLIVLMFITLVNTNVRIHGRHLIPYGSNHERIAALAISGGYIGVTLISMYIYFIYPFL